MANFLDSLGIGGITAGIDVYVSISSSGIAEMALLDPKTHKIKAYAQGPINYNESMREIESADHFKSVMEDLFAKCNINPQKSNIYMAVPTVWFGYKDNVPLMLDDNGVTNVVIGELEQSYVFKRKDPLPYWFDAAATKSDSRNIFYTAIQQDSKDMFQNTFKSLGAKLISITCSTFTNLKGLIVTEKISELIASDETPWDLLIINNTGFQLYGMKGKSITEYVEEPIALKTYDGDEAYAAINNAVQISLMGIDAGTLVILSETDLISAEYLSQNIQFGGNILAVEDNKFKENPFMDFGLDVIPEQQINISLGIIGLISPTDLLPVNVDFLESQDTKKNVSAVIEIPLTKDFTLVLTPQKALIYALILLAIFIIPLLLCFGLISTMMTNINKQNDELKNEISSIEAELKTYSQTDNNSFDPVNEIEKVLKNNRTKIIAYASLGESIPKDLYLTYFMTGDDGYIDIKGCANSVEDVYLFFKNLKDSLYESNLRLNKLDLKTGSLDSIINSETSSIDTAPYVFEITNMSDDQLKTFMKLLRDTNKDKDKDKDKENNSNNEEQAQ